MIWQLKRQIGQIRGQIHRNNWIENGIMKDYLLFYKDGERFLKEKKREVLCDKKELEKAFLSQTRIKHFKTNQPHIVEYFFSSQTDLAIFMLTDPTSSSKDSFNYTQIVFITLFTGHVTCTIIKRFKSCFSNLNVIEWWIFLICCLQK